MTEQNQAQALLATLRDALHQLEGALARTGECVDEITSQVKRLHEGIEALSDRQPRAVTPIGIEMLVDTAVNFLDAFRELESGIPDAQGDVDTLAAEMADGSNDPEG